MHGILETPFGEKWKDYFCHTKKTTLAMECGLYLDLTTLSASVAIRDSSISDIIIQSNYLITAN
jgi:hypothetical protein